MVQQKKLILVEKNDLYDYGLYIYQDSEYFKFSLDSILLAEYVNLREGADILDICSGNAPIPMILTTKSNNIHIDGIEIQKEVYQLAEESIKLNHLESKIDLYNVNARNFQIDKKYDIITCNPPYFKFTETSLVNDNNIKSIARHEVTITLEEIIDVVCRYLKDNGELYMVHRCDRLFELLQLLDNRNIGIRKVTFIKTKNEDFKFFLIKAQKNKKSDIKFSYKDISDVDTYKNLF